MMSSSLHKHTPSLTAFDPRGLTVRNVDYYRANAQDAAQARIQRQVYDGRGLMIEQWDPRLYQLQRSDHDTQATLRIIYSLGGQALRTDSVDAGWQLMLRAESGRVLESWDARGAYRRYEFDVVLRPVAIYEQAADEPALRCVERLAYAPSSSEDARLQRCGRLVRRDDPAGTLLYEAYGAQGQVVKQSRRFRKDLPLLDWPQLEAQRDAQLETERFVTTWRYSASGQLLEQVDARGNRQQLTYGLDAQLKSCAVLLADGRRQVLVDHCSYNASGQLLLERSGNGVTVAAHYAVRDDRLTALTVYRQADKAKPLQSLSYEYDAAGNVTRVEDSAQLVQWGRNAQVRAVSTYAYDTLYQLVCATGRESAQSSMGPALPIREVFTTEDDSRWRNYSQHYIYDAGGNLKTLRHVPSTGAGYTRQMTVAGSSNHAVLSGDGPAVPGLGAGFDAAGNQLELAKGQPMVWNVRGQLVRVTQVVRSDDDDDDESYVYDGSGQRVLKRRRTRSRISTHIQEVRYLPGLEIRSNTATGERLSVVTALAGRSPARLLQWEQGRPDTVADIQVRFCVSDHLGSCSLELDQAARLISQEVFYPFGGTAWWASATAVEATYKTIRYSGKERDASGLYYYGLRYYAPWLQRWINPDPMGDVDGLNRYAMVKGNPLRFRDDDGGQATFGELFQPNRGDILFGLAETVGSYRSFWSKLSERGDAMVAYFSGAQLQRWTAGLASPVRAFSSFRAEAPDLFAGLEHEPGEPPEIRRLKAQLIEQISVGVQPFYEGIVSRYSGCLATACNQQFARQFVSDLKAGNYSAEATAGEYIGEGLLGIQQKMITRSSKSALQTLMSPQSPAVVHFALDELDIPSVVSKSRRSTTASELRWLYRHRTQLAGKVVFYRGQIKVDAPWETHPVQWRHYRPRSAARTMRTRTR